MKLKYANVSVTDFDRALDFYTTRLGLRVLRSDTLFGCASFDTGGANLAIVRDPDPVRAGRHTGIGLCVDDLDAAHARLTSAGVQFTMPPTKQPWGGYMALFEDPDHNVFYLDQVPDAT